MNFNMWIIVLKGIHEQIEILAKEKAQPPCFLFEPRKNNIQIQEHPMKLSNLM